MSAPEQAAYAVVILRVQSADLRSAQAILDRKIGALSDLLPEVFEASSATSVAGLAGRLADYADEYGKAAS